VPAPNNARASASSSKSAPLLPPPIAIALPPPITESAPAIVSPSVIAPKKSLGADGVLPPKKPPRGDTLQKGAVLPAAGGESLLQKGSLELPKSKSSRRPSLQEAFPAVVTAETAPATHTPSASEVAVGSPGGVATKKHAVALFDYTGGTDRELSFAKDDAMFIVEADGSGWLLGEDLNGKMGFVPSSYVKIL